MIDEHQRFKKALERLSTSAPFVGKELRSAEELARVNFAIAILNGASIEDAEALARTEFKEIG